MTEDSENIGQGDAGGFDQAQLETIAAEAEAMGLFHVLTPEQRQQSKRDTLAAAPPGENVWVFAYGSLMWNPAFPYRERRAARLHGYHRKFCFWVLLGRGAPDRPGLMLALEPGGVCDGVAFRVRRDEADAALRPVWMREMLSGAYRPRWVTLRTSEGKVKAVTFVMNRDHPMYVGDLSLDATARHIAFAEGSMGPCHDYLVSTVAHLDELGIGDGPMHDLLNRAEEHRRRGAGPVSGTGKRRPG